MGYEELANLDKEISEAHERLVSLNNEYNELLTKLFNDQNNKNQAPREFVSEKERKYNKIAKNMRFFYWLIFILAMVASSFFGLPSGVFTYILFGNIIIYLLSSIVLSFKIAKERSKNEVNATNSPNVSKEELYEKLCQARELYHSLRKKRDDVVILDKDYDYHESLEQIDTILEEKEEEKTLGLEKN